MNNDLITERKQDKRGVTLRINDEIALWLSRDLYLERGEPQEGQAIDWDEFRQWLLPRQYPQALNAAVAFLTLRARSTQEVRRKLQEKHYLDDAVEMALYKLEKEKLLDDEAFAVAWAKACAQKRMGKRRILSELWQKGVDRAVAQRAVDGLDGEESDEAAVQLAQKLVRRYGDEEPKKAMNKLMAAMARRGYAFDEADQAVREALRRAQEDE